MEKNWSAGCSPPPWEKRKWSDDSAASSKIPGFESETFFSSTSTPYSRSGDYCPYSIRETQLSLEYRYDVLLIYDPDENSYYVEKLMEHLRPENLKIFDLVRDAPPGLPQRRVLQSTLQHCRYTCIIITRKFLSTFWLQLRTDMSIQDMLDNEQKMYSVIIVVMDATVKRPDLPLDLATLSPLFITERFFENRIKLAFSKTSLLPPLSLSSKSSLDLNPPKYNDIPTARFDSVPMYAVQSSASSVKEPVNSQSSFARSHSRFPTEHGDGTFVMPPSIFPSHVPDPTLSMQRTLSVTVSSTGLRQPQETSDSTTKAINPSKDTEQSMVLHSVTEVKNFFSGDSSRETSDKSSSNTGSDISQAYKEEDFSFLNRLEPEDENARNPTIRPQADFETPTFFSVNEPSLMYTMSGEFSELEISNASSLPSVNSVESRDSRPPKCSSMESSGECTVPTLQSTDFCTSLPADLDKPQLASKKKSRSLRSLVSLKFAGMSRTLSLRKKKK